MEGTADFSTIDASVAAQVRSGEGGHGGLLLGDEFLSDLGRDDRSTSYGIIAAQRRRNGQVWLVLSGLAGPATYACAKVLQSMLAATPRQREAGAPSPVIWCVVTAAIYWNDANGAPGDVRQLTGQSIEGAPHYWPSPHGSRS